jgi:hypothetical protein
MKTKILTVIFFLALCGSAYAAQPFSAGQLDRLRAAKRLLSDVDSRSFSETLQDLQKTSFSEGHLQVLEAVAQTYAEIAREYDVETPERKKWLYGMVQLNLAYLQLGGGEEQATASALNTLIQRKLLRHLPPETLSDPRLVQPLE